jgi:hypothetical protein
VSVVEKGRRGAGRSAARRGRRGPLLLLLLGSTLALLWWNRAFERALESELTPEAQPFGEPAPLGSTHAPPPEVGPQPSAPEAEAVPAEPLPALAESDALARDVATGLSAPALVAALIADAGVIDRFVAAIDQIAEGTAPRRDLAALRPAGSFLVLGREPALRIDPSSYRRYDALAQAFAALDARALVAAYRRLAPLCEQAYRALGYPEGGFEQRLRAALALLAATPRIDASPALVAAVKRYEFADPELESLADAQKQLLRMGPKNAALVVAELREIEALLGGAGPER